MIYNSLTKSVMLRSSDLRISNKIKFEKKSNMLNGELFEQFFPRKKIDSLQEIIQRSKILTVYELFIVENVKELFRQVRQNGELHVNFVPVSFCKLLKTPADRMVKKILE